MGVWICKKRIFPQKDGFLLNPYNTLQGLPRPMLDGFTAGYLKNWYRQWRTTYKLSILLLQTPRYTTIFKIYELFQQSKEMSYMIYVPYDSHSLQLLIKDITELPKFGDTLKPANRLVDYFDKALKQYSILRDQQFKEYGRHTALILAVITR